MPRGWNECKESHRLFAPYYTIHLKLYIKDISGEINVYGYPRFFPILMQMKPCVTSSKRIFTVKTYGEQSARGMTDVLLPWQEFEHEIDRYFAGSQYYSAVSQ